MTATRAVQEKRAPVSAPVHSLISERWSPRAFSSEPVDQEQIESLLEAARWAPSCMNEQPWTFVLATRDSDPEAHQRIVETLMPVNAEWAGKAPLLMIAVARLTFTRNGQPNKFALYDTGQAVAQLTLQATALGLSVHQMGGFDPAKASELLGIPEGYQPISAIAIGHAGDPSDLSAEMKTRELGPRARKPASDFAFRAHWQSN